MNPIHEMALNETLQSTAGAQIKEVTFTNRTVIPLHCQLMASNGDQINIGIWAPGQSAKVSPIYVGQYYMFTTIFSGAFFTAIKISNSRTKSYAVDHRMLSHPNVIGSFPKPTADSPIPTSSQRVVVGCGRAPNRDIVVREQFWERGVDSYELAAGETRTISFTETTGRDETSSSQESVAKSVGVSASGGWGPVSASASASLSESSSTFQQVTVKSEKTHHESVEMTNPSKTESRLFLKWTLTDVITVLNKTGGHLSSMVMRERPTLVGGPYNPDRLTTATGARRSVSRPAPAQPAARKPPATARPAARKPPATAKKSSAKRPVTALRKAVAKRRNRRK